MIDTPHNDRACLGAVTETIRQLVADRDPELVAIAEQHADTESLASWLRSLPQRDDEGLPGDGPKVAACRPPQRLRLDSDEPNCFERGAIFLGAAELIDPGPVRRLATVETPNGLHTFPTEDGVPVILDPQQTRNAVHAAIRRAARNRNRRNAGAGGAAGASGAVNGAPAARAPVALTPSEAVDWIAEVAVGPARRFARGPRRVRNGHRAMRGALDGRPLCIGEVRDVAFVLALADREADRYGPAGKKIVRTCAHAVDRLDQAAARRWMDERSAVRNAPELRIGRFRITPNTPLLGALARVSGRLGTKVGVEALRVKLAALGVTPPVLSSIEEELNREGLSLGPLAAPPPMLGSLAALTPEAIAGRWLAQKI